MELDTYQTLIQPVIERATKDPEHSTVVHIHEDNTEERISARQFHENAVAYSRALSDIGIGCDDLVILVLKHSPVLLSAFWGALYLGAIPSIFPFLTEKLDPILYMERVKKLVAHSGAKAVITFPDFKQDLRVLLADVDCQVLSTQDVQEDRSEEFTSEFLSHPSSEKIAFLQHSSGTTGLQKGVALSHQAVLNQITAYSLSIDLQTDDVIVSWLPLYHDMGLIAGFVLPIVTGTLLVLMSPFHWVRDPKILLFAIHNYKGTLCWLPNFAYNHLARSLRPRHIEGVDLSHWRAVINCSEPVYYASHQKFLERFGEFGFKQEALSVSYAMAENTFAVTQTPTGQVPELDWVQVGTLQEERRAVPVKEGSAGSVAMVSCGFPIAGTEMAVVGEEGSFLPDRHVGEIVLRSNCMLTSYYRRPDITAQAIKNGWYYTGDMGYVADGQLYISGRKKDLIIVGGKNVYPQDLEAIANQVEGIHPGRAVAFGLPDERIGSEVVVMVCELSDHTDSFRKSEIERELRHQVVAQTEVTLSDVRLVKRRWLIKTSSGKIARSDNRSKYLSEFRS
jgi:acyl-CoA synthetase (AMP-forming)/AMP-acid ligase II